MNLFSYLEMRKLSQLIFSDVFFIVRGLSFLNYLLHYVEKFSSLYSCAAIFHVTELKVAPA